MKSAVIGFDTSCYTTSVAAVSLDGEVLASCRKLLPVKQGERGLRQSQAVFIHVRQLPQLVEELSSKIEGYQIKAVCASTQPRDDAQSYMPVFTVGDAQGRSLAAMLGVPYFGSTHQRGHISAATVQSNVSDGDLLAVHLSGGTTEILSLCGEKLTLLGGTMDLHAGQVVDRTGVALGLPFPSGPYLQQLAVQAKANALLPVSFEKNGLYCHMSGAETQIQRWIQSGNMAPEQIAIEVYDFISRSIARLVLNAAQKTAINQALIAGGVASSALFRRMVVNRIQKRNNHFKVCFGKPEYSGDNAVGAALIGLKKYRETLSKEDD